MRGLSRCLLAQCTVASLEGGKTTIDDTVLLQTAIKGYSRDHRTQTNLMHGPYYHFGRKYYFNPFTLIQTLDPNNCLVIPKDSLVQAAAVAEMCRDDRGQNCGDREDPSYPHIATADLLQNIIHQQLPWASLCVMCLFLLQEAYYTSVFTAGYKCGGGVDGGT